MCSCRRRALARTCRPPAARKSAPAILAAPAALQQGAAREAYEEALADVEIGSLLAVVHVLHAHQVHVFFRARLRSPNIGAGPESLDVKLVDEADIPWSDLAFASVEFALKRFLEDRSAGKEGYYFAEFDRRRS